LERTFIDKRPALRLTARTPSHPRIVASLLRLDGAARKDQRT
jgi:hypothetical protein